MITEGYRVKEYSGPVKRYCQTLDLKDDPELIAEYRKRHSQAEAWSEIRVIQSIGILEMEIYILDTRLLMIVETPLNFDWDTAMAELAPFPGNRNEKSICLCSRLQRQVLLLPRNGD